MNTPTIFIADDDASVREGLTLLLSVAGYVVEAFASGEALLMREPSGIGCILLDLRMEGMGGQEVLTQLRASGERMPVIFLTGYGDVPTVVQAMRAGALDFLTKPVDGALLIQRIEAAIEISRSELEKQLAHEALLSVLGRLTQREREVLKQAMQGLDTRDTALRMSISHRTVEVHRAHILQKTGAPSLAELCRRIAWQQIEL